MTKIPIILDGDPGHDDAIAWMLAKANEKTLTPPPPPSLSPRAGVGWSSPHQPFPGTTCVPESQGSTQAEASPLTKSEKWVDKAENLVERAEESVELEILACTSVCGNQTIAKTSYNARRVMTLIGLDVPFAQGGPKPLFGDPIIAPTVHGESGLDGPALPEPGVETLPISAVQLMAQVLKESPEPVTIVPTGPLTNVGALLLLHPELKTKIARISLMGGGIAFGNWTPAAEFNILVDPEAADIVFKSGIPITMAGLDVTQKALVFPEDFERIRSLNNPVASVVADWLDFFYGFHRAKGYAGAPVHDAVAVAALIKPEILTSKDYYVQIETSGDFCRGMTIADYFGHCGMSPNASVLVDIDRQGFIDLLVEAAASYGKEQQ